MVKYNLNKYQISNIIEEVLNDMYVDKWLSGADTIVEAADKYKGAHD